MNISRYFNEALVKLEMTTVIEPRGDEESLAKFQQRSKETVLEELVDLLETGNRIGNHHKLIVDFINRERKATTGIGHGVAIPHVRTMQAKDFIIAFARSTKGYEFEAIDNEPVHMFFIMAAPPYDDTLYLRIFKSLAEMLQYESFREELMTLKSPGELIRALRSME